MGLHKWLCLFFLGLALAMQPARSLAQTLDRDAFAANFLAKAKARWPEARIEQTDPLALSIYFRGEKSPYRIYMDNAWAQYEENPPDLDVLVSSRLDNVDENRRLKDAVPDRNHVFAVLKGADYLETVSRQMAASGDATGQLPLHQALNPELTVLFVEDTATGMRFLVPGDLKQMKLSEAELMPLAVANMRRHFIVNPPEFAAPKDMPGVHYIHGDGFYDPSLMLMADYWETLGLKGEPVVFPIARDFVVVVDSSMPEDVEIAKNVAIRSYPESTYNISPRGFVRRNGSWVPLEQRP